MDLIKEHIDEIPDGFGWILAARAWHYNPKTGLLQSLISSADWRPGETVEAKCLTTLFEATRRAGNSDPIMMSRSFSPLPCTDTPGEFCKCGLWGLKQPASFRDKSNPQWLFTGCVFGLVELTGRVSEGTLGYRAQLARVVALVRSKPWWVTAVFSDEDFERQLIGLSERYAVPLLDRWPMEEGSITRKAFDAL